jgi:hypothetical protein
VAGGRLRAALVRAALRRHASPDQARRI